MFQYFLTTIIFYDRFIFPNNINFFLSLIIMGVILGNLINHYVESKTYKIMVNCLAFISALILVAV